jgi:hypothetical protein
MDSLNLITLDGLEGWWQEHVLLVNWKDFQMLLLKNDKSDKTKVKTILSLAVYFGHIIFKCK